jgi:dipeptidyl aminopeptidase/acylaminoacyl peptidase
VGWLADERPPLLVKVHGGPTAACSSNLNVLIQYWTSRGFAVLDVNYGGSTGYGRAYRQRLYGQWGVVDVDDCVNGALFLAHAPALGDGGGAAVDIERLAIDGGSAGGFTTLAALAFRSVFRAGCSNYGVADLARLAADTHKFEARYLDTLVGPYPQARALYEARSPAHHLEGLSCPVILFQGDQDKIVPASQAELMVAALKAKGLPVAYVVFAGEQHGFRQAANIRAQVDGEFTFFCTVFGIVPADADRLPPLHIDNWPLPAAP